MIYQKEILEINVRLPDGTFDPHPAIVISNNDVNELEDNAIIVMLSSQPKTDDYSFWLSDDMLTKKLPKKTQVRCHLISMIIPADIFKHLGYIKQEHFNKLLNHICAVTF